MLIWALFAAMTAVAASIVLVPLMRRAPTNAAPLTEAGEITVYRDQLGEIDRDLEGGLVGPAEADAARAEISRRILRASRAEVAPAVAPGPSRRSRLVAVVAVIVLPLIAVGTYLKLGHPDRPDQPLASRKVAPPDGQSIEDLVVKVEAHLAANPTDARGWDVLAPVYMRLGRMEQAAAAWRTGIRLAGSSEKRQNGLGEALTAGADGIVTAEARTAFQKSLEVEPAGVLPRMYLALALFQEGKPKESAEAWRALLAMGTGGELWAETARDELAKAEAAAGIAPTTPPPAAPAPAPSAAPAAPGPSAADVEAAAQMSPEERAKLIETMVGRLEARLAASGGTIDEWERLIRAQKMLGRLADAKTTLERARAALAADAAALARLDALTTGLTP